MRAGPQHFAIALTAALIHATLGCSSSTGGGGALPEDEGGEDSGGRAVVDAHAQEAADSGAAAPDASCLQVNEAGVTYGTCKGSQGPGDRDDGGGMEAGSPDVSQDAIDQPLYAPCWDNAQCTTGICFAFGPKGQFCTKTCSSNADCPAPSLGCNGMGVCRVGD
jgi:hypothetical protein